MSKTQSKKKTIKSPKQKKMNLIMAIKSLFADLIVNESSAMEYRINISDDIRYVFQFSLLGAEDNEGNKIPLNELKFENNDNTNDETKEVE